MKQPTARGAIILERLEELSWSVAEVERRTPLTKNTIANAIYGPRDPQRKTIEILADVLDLPVEVLSRADREPTATGEPVEGAPVAEDDASWVPSFGSWLFRRGNRLLWVSALGSLTTGFLLLQDQDRKLLSLVQGTHFLVLFLLLTLLPRAPEVERGAPHRLRMAAGATGDFRRYWGAVWLLWVFLYVALFVTTWMELLPLSDDGAGMMTRGSVLVLNLLQNCGTVLLFLCYEVLARPTIKDDFSRKQVLPTEAWLAVVILVGIAEGLIWWTLSWEYQQWFGWLSGFGQGAALALLVGRLDSKYVDPPAFAIGLLYLYAVIQGAWPVFRYEPELMLVLTFVALVLKCLLFLFVSWLFESKVILFYLGRMRQLDQSVRQDRADFLKRFDEGRRA